MSVHVKICGITDVRAALAAADAGTDAIGFVFTESPRRLDPEDAAAIASSVPESIEKVAVFLRPDPVEVAEVLEVFPADVVQADYQAVSAVGFPDVAVLPVIRSSGGSADELATLVSGIRFQFEGSVSGVGETADHDVAAILTRHGQMTLAGGLHPANVSGLIRQVRPYGVDVSSGVESSPGVKDVGRIRDFIRAVRETEKIGAPA